jgi:hypothetical protein
MKRVVVLITAVVSATLLAACPPPQFPRWRDTTGAARNEDQWGQDYGVCSKANPFPENATADDKKTFIRRYADCMATRGWALKSENSN